MIIINRIDWAEQWFLFFYLGKYKRFKASEAASNDPETGTRDEEPAALPPGVPSQALRGMERVR